MLLFDADSLAYFAAAGAENRWWEAVTYDEEGSPLNHHRDRLKADVKAWVDTQVYHSVEYEQESEPAPAHFAYKTINSRMETILDHCGPYAGDGVMVLLTGTDNFRNDVATIKPYKGNRKYKKPILLPDCREFMEAYHGAVVIDGREADDECSIQIFNQLKQGKTKNVIVGIDKDLDTIGDCMHYNWQRNTFYEVNALQGTRWFYQQLLQGDTGDNIPGCAGVGKDSKLLADLETMDDEVDMYHYVLEQYAASYGSRYCTYGEMVVEDVVQENGRLLWMQQWVNQGWVPPTKTDAEGNRLWDRLGDF